MPWDKIRDRFRDLTDVEVTEMMDMIEEGADDADIAKHFNVDVLSVQQLRDEIQKDV